MRRRVALTALAVLAALAVPAWALAGTLTLHPAGFGEHSYAAWKAQQGLPDSGGGANQALYFQKMTSTPTFAAGVAVFKGFDKSPLPVDQLSGLSFWYGVDGHCGAGAPRFNVTVEYTQAQGTNNPGDRRTFFIGCAAMAPGPTATAPNGRVYQERTAAAPFATAFCSTGCGPFPTSGAVVTGLSIVFDEGNDVGQGYVYLDNIQVATTSAATPSKCWTSASDNSNSSAGCPDPSTSSVAGVGLLSVALSGLAVDPTDTELVGALNLAYPGVPLSAWSLYPNVY
jgi:hypothetical protein